MRQREQTVMKHRPIALTFSCVFVLFPCLIGLFEAVVTYEAVVRGEINSKMVTSAGYHLACHNKHQ